MPSDVSILKEVEAAFAGCQRPGHFTNYTHCEECAEHDQVLRSRDVHSLSIDDVGNVGWDPICFITPEGFAYYLPALLRLTLAEPQGPEGWYGVQLLSHLRSDGSGNNRVQSCTPAMRSAVVRFLKHLVETRSRLIDDYAMTDELFQTIEIWSENAEPDASPNNRPPRQLPPSPEVQPPDSLRTPSSGGCG